MKNNRVFYVLLAVYGLGILCIGCGTRDNSNKTGSKNSVQKAAISLDFSLKELSDDRIVKLSDLKGKPVFLDFWATWCPPCRNATPYVEKLNKKFKDKIHIVGVNLDSNSDLAKKYISKHSIDYLQLGGYGTEISTQYGVRGIPSFFIIDSKGELVNNYTGFTNGYYESWIKEFNKLLRESQ